MPGADVPSFTFAAIGVAHTPFTDKASAPRQPQAALDVTGTIELYAAPGIEHALEDLEGWDRIWVVFVFHLVSGWRPKVLPPRSAGKRRGVFSTRSPHRPNPIGISVVRLDAVEDRVLRVRDVDMVDGTPVLDIKPYVPWVDAHPRARTGWLEPLAMGDTGDGTPRDPEPGFDVRWSDEARAQADWLRARNIDIADPVARLLSLGPQPHPYRRIRSEGGALRLAYKEWRVRFRVDGRTVTIERITSGYRSRELALGSDERLVVHRVFVATFGG
jgi:tRNA-Thr(GGU) m(6)t(6)A37 methyltransferase TsaA